MTHGGNSSRAALRVLQAGAVAVVLASAPYKSFDLDRFFIPKELVLCVTAILAGLLCVVRARRVPIGRVDQLLMLWLVLGISSAVFATNWWLAERAVAISLAGATCFWCARAVSRSGLSRQLVAALALAGVLGAATAVVQAYGVRSELFSLNRAPGGMLGNRNFIAHLCAVTVPAILFSGIRAPSRASLGRWCAGLALATAALILSRSRAGWLGVGIGVCVLIICGTIAIRHRDGALTLARVVPLVVAAIVGAGAALVLPNTLDWKSDSPYLDTAHSLVNYKAGSGRGRLVQYGNSLRMSLRHPVLGVGPGNWPVVYPKFASDGDPSIGQDGMTSNPWPSSDWITFLSERGAIALAILVLAVLALVADGVRGLRDDDTEESRLASAVLLATLAALMVVGCFDAVLLLPVPALVGWALLGALAVRTRERAAVQLSVVRRLAATMVILGVGGAAAARSATELMAMKLYAGSSRIASLERASALDPGSFRIHMKLADTHRDRGDCARALVHANAAKRLFPFSPAARRVASSCGG